MKKLLCVLALLSVWLAIPAKSQAQLCFGNSAIVVQQPAVAFQQVAFVQPSFGFASVNVAAPFVNVGVSPFFGFNTFGFNERFVGGRRGFVGGGVGVNLRGARSVRQTTRTRIR